MVKFRLFYDNQFYGPPSQSYTISAFGIHQCDSIWSMFKDRYLDENGEGRLYPNRLGYYPIVNARIVQVSS